MANDKRRRFRSVCVACVLAIAAFVAPVHADEVWVAPTYQQDLGGLGVASNVFWPVTAIGAVRLAWAVPNDLLTFQSAKVALIPHAPGGAATLNIFVCPAETSDPVAAGCAGPFPQAFTGVTNQLIEVEIGSIIASRIGTPGATYLAVLAYTTPTTTTDHILGLRFTYAPTVPAGVATLGANTFTGTQTAPAFAGSGASLTNVNASLLGGLPASAFAPVAHGHNVSQITNAATLGANTFAGTQTIGGGNLELGTSTSTAGNVTRNGSPLLHNVGSDNTFLGVDAGNLAMTGAGNTAVGAQALITNASGGTNTAIGLQALTNNVDGNSNTAIGASSLYWTNTGFGNTGSGDSALYNNVSGNGNTAAGAAALYGNVTGHDNTAVGIGALNNAPDGSFNVAVGLNAGTNLAVGSNNIYLGANASGVASFESDTMYLGGTQTRTFMAGVRGTTTGFNDAVGVVIDSNGQLGTISSSRRFKEDIHDMADASRRLLKLRPVTFRYTQAYIGGAKPIQYGLIAEEVAEVFPELAVRGADGNVETVHYETLNVLLVNEVQKQQQRIEALERKLNDLLARLTPSN